MRHESDNIIDEMEELRDELQHPSESLSIIELFASPELKWPLITSLVLIVGTQFSGIKAVTKQKQH